MLLIICGPNINNPGLEFHRWEVKAVFIFKRAFPLENLKVYGKHVKGHQGQDKGNGGHGLRDLREIPGLITYKVIK